MDYPILMPEQKHQDVFENLEQARAILNVLTRIGEVEIAAMIDFDSDGKTGYEPLKILLDNTLLHVQAAYETVNWNATSTYDPGVLFEHIFDHLKFPPKGVKKINYMNEVFGRLVKKIGVDQEKEIQEPEKNDAKYYLNEFIDECCILETGAQESLFNLYKKFKAWYEVNISQEVISKDEFCNVLEERFNKDPDKNQLIFMGLKLSQNMSEDINHEDLGCPTGPVLEDPGACDKWQ